MAPIDQWLLALESLDGLQIAMGGLWFFFSGLFIPTFFKEYRDFGMPKAIAGSIFVGFMAGGLPILPILLIAFGISALL